MGPNTPAGGPSTAADLRRLRRAPAAGSLCLRLQFEAGSIVVEFLCMCVCMCVCVFVRLFVCLFGCLLICVYLCFLGWLVVCVYVCLCVFWRLGQHVDAVFTLFVTALCFSRALGGPGTLL